MAQRTSTFLVEPAGLAQALAGPHPPVVLDVRWNLGGPPGRDAYNAGHIPGAVFVDLDHDLAAPPGVGGRHPLPDAQQFIAAMQRAGVDGDREVVVYDQGNSTIAARAWWLLRDYAHPSAKVLNGGWAGWLANGGEVSTEETAPARGNFEGRPGTMPVIDADDIPAAAENGILIDARAAERYRGDVEPVDPVAGHIPGALSLPTSGNVDEQGRFLTMAELRERFAAADIREGVMTTSYCGSGITACHQILALNLAGLDAALYPGSWSGWITDDTRPIATGAETVGRMPLRGEPGADFGG